MSKIEKLQHFLSQYQDRPFETGVCDCALFIADWINELTGQDFAKPFKGRYHSDLGSARLIRQLGYNNLDDLVQSTLANVGVKLDHPMLAKRGDVVLARSQGQRLCAIVTGQGVAAISHQGLIILPLSDIEMAWCIDEVIQ